MLAIKPVAGNSFDILDWGSLGGRSFSTVQLPALNGAAMWNTSQLYTSDVLSVVPTFLLGDINRDGKVTVADISALLSALANLNGYEASYNQTGPQLKLIGDLNGDGHMNNADVQALISLVANHTAGCGGGSGSSALTAVPEPTAWSLMVAGILGVAALRRRHC